MVIPTYNEENNIAMLIRSLHKNLGERKYEIVVVDDSSSDSTPQIIDNFAKSKKINLVALHRYSSRGILSAIQDGVTISTGKVIVTIDADFSHPPEVVPRLLDNIKNNDIVSGSRFAGNSMDAPFLRKFGTIVINKIIRWILGLEQKDCTGGFHAIKKSKFNQLQFRYNSLFGEFDMELLLRANKLKFKIKEIPYTYRFRKEGKSKCENLLKYGWIYLIRAFQLRLRE